MVDIKGSLELYNKISSFAVVVQHYCHDRKPDVSFISSMFKNRLKDIYVDRIEYDGNDFDIDISSDKVLICMSFNNKFVPSPIFEIAITHNDIDRLGGWAEYNTNTGILSFPYMN